MVRERGLATKRWLAMSFGLVVSRRSAAIICARTRSSGSASNRGCVSASRSRSKASSRFSFSVRSEPRRYSSRLALKPMLDGVSFEPLAETPCASRSPAPSSSRPATMLATPGLSAGSCVGAAGEGEIHGDHGNGRLAAPARLRCRRARRRARCLVAPERARATAAAPQRGSEAAGGGRTQRSRAFLLALRGRVLDQIAGHRAASCRARSWPRRAPDRRSRRGRGPARLTICRPSSRWSARRHTSAPSSPGCPGRRSHRRSAGSWRARVPRRVTPLCDDVGDHRVDRLFELAAADARLAATP